MPFYTFKCNGCGDKIEKFLSISEKNNQYNCLKCSHSYLRIISSSDNLGVLELGSRYHGWKNKKGIKNILEKRSKNDMLNNIGELIEKHGIEEIKKTSLLDNKKNNH